MNVTSTEVTFERVDKLDLSEEPIGEGFELELGQRWRDVFN